MAMQSIIEQIGKYNNHFYAVRINSIGFRCGYVRVLKSDNFKKLKKIKETGTLDIECHGGITFAEFVSKDQSNFLPPGNWIGFDMAHRFDRPSIEYAACLFGLSCDEIKINREYFERLHENGSYCSIQYVVNECHNIIDQLIEKYDE